MTPPQDLDPTPENQFLEFAWSGRNIFLTGMAGTGKSTLLRAFIDGSAEPLLSPRTWPDGSARPIPNADQTRSIDITSPTGIAALNIGGRTIHSYSGMMLGPRGDQTDEGYLEWLRSQPYPSIRSGFRRVQWAECLVIDEISMLPGRQMQFIEYLFRTIRDDERPWGGCQVIVVGDFMQLAPVRTNDAAPYDWAFENPVWERSGFAPVVLKKVRRQDDAEFVSALSGVREGEVTGASARTLHARVSNFPASDIPRLFTHNNQVDRWNNVMLDGLPGEEVHLHGSTSGPDHRVKFLTENLLTPEDLVLKPGARVMFTVNHKHGEYVNGTIGTVESIGMDWVVVRLPSGFPVQLERFTWKAGEDSNVATFSQFPLRLAYAMTIHKIQGLTLDSAYVDIRAAREPGQVYVALSRVRTLAGLHLKEWFNGIHVSNRALEFHRALAAQAA